MIIKTHNTQRIEYNDANSNGSIKVDTSLRFCSTHRFALVFLGLIQLRSHHFLDDLLQLFLLHIVLYFSLESCDAFLVCGRGLHARGAVEPAVVLHPVGQPYSGQGVVPVIVIRCKKMGKKKI